MKKLNKWLILLLAGGGLYGLSLWVQQGPVQGMVAVKLPDRFSTVAASGRRLFAENCQTCHGVEASGSDKGPPLIHKIYESSHHGDGAFFRAAKLGVRAHHWRFGNMPPVATVTEEDVAKIIRYIREVQMANGIL